VLDDADFVSVAELKQDDPLTDAQIFAAVTKDEGYDRTKWWYLKQPPVPNFADKQRRETGHYYFESRGAVAREYCRQFHDQSQRGPILEIRKTTP
jgi:hypothetical protein